MMQLSKSDYMDYLRHPALLWLKKHDKSKLPPIDDATQAMFDAGHKFEAYGEALFSGGVALGFNDYNEYKTLTARTQHALQNGSKTIFQSRFEWGEYNCLPDIIDVIDGNLIDLYEIKSSTRVKDEHIYDLAFQRAVIEANDLKIRKIFVIYVNNEYVRHGDIVPEELTKMDDVTLAVHNLASFTEATMPLALETIHAATMPDPSPTLLGKFGDKKEWQAIYDSLVGTPAPDYTDTEQAFNKTELKRFLGELEFPLYFLDYETMSAVVPYFDGHRPYQQIPSQYSLHILDSPDAELRHKEYLHCDNSDPSLAIAQHLIEDIGDHGSIITWNMSFEKACNVTLGQINPQYADAMAAINERIVDLMIPFKPKNGWYSDPRFEGSASIKKVLPVVVPTLSYKTLGIQNGGAAQSLWMQAVLDESRDDKEQILDDLLKYCGLDTLAMVEIYNVLRKI
ncbi:MAG: DUF2779 domain-containing protein [Candidatus Saccharibacteria bacterium]|nr:DUF2779 domain-containing protein [Candidatus Saccharibacteria bacterium]